MSLTYCVKTRSICPSCLVLTIRIVQKRTLGTHVASPRRMKSVRARPQVESSSLWWNSHLTQQDRRNAVRPTHRSCYALPVISLGILPPQKRIRIVARGRPESAVVPCIRDLMHSCQGAARGRWHAALMGLNPPGPSLGFSRV
jgi:hypothetical protein